MTNAKVSLNDVFQITNRIEEKLDKMEVRVGALELWRAGVQGQIALIAGGVGIVMTLTTDWVKKKLNL